MTAILALITPKFVILVADRRITRTVRTETGWKVVSQDDTDTKSIYMDGRYIMGFTGVAKIGERPMERWVCETLDESNPENYFDALAERIGQDFEQYGYTQKHCFMSVGFNEALIPEIVLVSNYHDHNGVEVSRGHFRAFSFVVSRTPLEQRFSIRSVGSVSVPEVTMRWFVKQCRRTRDSPTKSIVAMLQVLRDMARVSEGTIGTACVVTAISPNNLPIRVNPRFLNYPEDKFILEFFLSFSVPDEQNAGDVYVYHPALWSRSDESGYGYLSVMEPEDPSSHGLPSLISRFPEDSVYPTEPRAHPFAAYAFSDFPHHPIPR